MKTLFIAFAALVALSFGSTVAETAAAASPDIVTAGSRWGNYCWYRIRCARDPDDRPVRCGKLYC